MTETDPPVPVVIAGWVGSDNLGDELIHRRMIRELTDLGMTPSSVSQNPDTTTRVHEVKAFRFRRLFGELGAAQGMVFGGGTLIQQDSSLLNTAVHLQRLRMARIRNVPAIAAGLGIGQIRTPGAARAVKGAFNKLLRIAVRDHDSRQALQALGVNHVEVGCDLVFAEDVKVTAEDVQAVGLRPPLAGGVLPTSIRRPQHTDAWIGAMAGALDASATASGLSTRFIAMDRVRDHAVHLAVAERMTTPAEALQPGLDDVISAFGASRVTIGMRYHAAVASLVAGRPAVGLNYSQKVASLATESDGAVVSSSVSPEALDAIPARVAEAVGRADRVAGAVEMQRARMGVVRDVLAALLS